MVSSTSLLVSGAGHSTRGQQIQVLVLPEMARDGGVACISNLSDGLKSSAALRLW